MNRILIPAVLMLAALLAAPASAAIYTVPAPAYGDVNEDGVVDIDDVNAVINNILRKSANRYADVNCDGLADIDDLNHVVNVIVHKAGSLDAPASVRAMLSGSVIEVNWSAVDGAESYSVYSSNDGTRFTLVGTKVESNTFVHVNPPLGQVRYRVRAVASNAVSDMSSESNRQQYGSSFYGGLYLGLWGFNQTLYSVPVGQLNAGSMPAYTQFINWLQPANGSALYYAVDNALNSLEQHTELSDANSVTLVTFTDCSDRGSTSLNEQYDTQNAYLQALSERIHTTQVNGRPIQAYTIGMKGDDVADLQQFAGTLRALSTTDDHAFIVDDMSQADSRFQEIAGRICRQSYSLQLKVIREDNGTRIRFTFDDVGNNADAAQCYIEGTYRRSDDALTDVVYHGISTASGSLVPGKRSGMFVTFSFVEAKLPDGRALPLGVAKEFMRTSGGAWQACSEFTGSNVWNSSDDHHKAVVLLALDCSESLHAQFGRLKAVANSFIETLANVRTIQADADFNYWSALTQAQFYTNSAYQIAASRSIYACGWLTQTSRGNRDGCSARWEPTASLTTSPYQWWFVGAYGASATMWVGGPEDNIIDIKQQADSDRNYAFAGVARVLRAYGMMLMTDLYGEMPYSDVTKDCCIAIQNVCPTEAYKLKYDNGRTIFMGCIADIEQAIELLEKAQAQQYQGANSSLPSLQQSDWWNGGDLNKWLKLAYLLKARWLNHLSKKSPGSYKEGKYDADEILACLDKAMQSNYDNTIIRHVDEYTPFHDRLGWDEPVNYATLFSVQGMNNTIRATKQMVDNLENFAGYGVEDPRADKLLPWCRSRISNDSPAELTWSEDGKWRRSLGVDMHTTVRNTGAPYAMNWDNDNNRWYCNTTNAERQNDTVYVVWKSGAKGYYGTVDLLNRWNKANNNSATTAMFYNRPSSPGYIAMFHEACFIRAEVLFNQGKKAEAYEWYKKGVQASIEAMNSQCNTWCTEDANLADCPAFAPMKQAEIDNFLNNGIGTAANLTLGKIMTQKQIAMFYSGEIWNDMRRYDYDSNIFLNWEIPAEYYINSASLRTIPQGKMWRRWQQSSREQNYNADNLQAIGAQVPGADMTYMYNNVLAWYMAPDVWTIPVWWDSDQP